MSLERRVTRRRLLRLGGGAVIGVASLAPFMRPPPAIPPAQPLRGPAQATGPQSSRIVMPGLRADGPLLSPVVSNGSVYQGGALRVGVPGATTATATVFGRDYPLVPGPDGPIGYIGIGVLDDPGETILSINAVDPVLGPLSLARPITVLRTNWTVDYITIPPSSGDGDGDPVDAEKEAERRRQEIETLSTTYGLVTPRKWIEPWLTPLTARITGYFGEQRSFNGGPVGGHHGGTDFGIAAGSPVHSTNAGVVMVARNFPVRGNMVIVDHGSGILSGYAHLSAFDVAEGQVVAQGHVLGKVGSTGLSTGAHLHWELSVHGVLVDGLRWLDRSQGF